MPTTAADTEEPTMSTTTTQQAHTMTPTNQTTSHLSFQEEKAWAQANGIFFPFDTAAEWEWANRVGVEGLARAISHYAHHVPEAVKAADQVLAHLEEEKTA